LPWASEKLQAEPQLLVNPTNNHLPLLKTRLLKDPILKIPQSLLRESSLDSATPSTLLNAFAAILALRYDLYSMDQIVSSSFSLHEVRQDSYPLLNIVMPSLLSGRLFSLVKPSAEVSVCASAALMNLGRISFSQFIYTYSEAFCGSTMEKIRLCLESVLDSLSTSVSDEEIDLLDSDREETTLTLLSLAIDRNGGFSIDSFS
jgi:hypothetical protein